MILPKCHSPVSRLHCWRHLFGHSSARRWMETSSLSSPEEKISATDDAVTSSQSPSTWDEEFRVLEGVWPKKKQREVRVGPHFKKNIPPPRSKRMPTNQPWPSVWPAARMFHPAVVPLPIHMGYIEKPELYSPPSKWANAELMKIPNFLHLTPPAVKAHCSAIKKFCTEWPKQLDSDEECSIHFPIEVVFTDFVHAAPTIRDPRSRMVKMIFKLDSIPLDFHAKDKMKKLLNCGIDKHYNDKTGMVTLVSDRCPTKSQNYGFLQYLLTAIFFESWKTEEWERTDITPVDWGRFYWERSSSFQKLYQYFKDCALDPDHDTSEAEPSQDQEKEEEKDGEEEKKGRIKNPLNEKELLERIDKRMQSDSCVKRYAESLTNLFDRGENEETLDQYRQAVVDLLFPPNTNNSGSQEPTTTTTNSSPPSSCPSSDTTTTNSVKSADKQSSSSSVA